MRSTGFACLRSWCCRSARRCSAIVSHRLWERPRGRASREQTVLFNLATTLTLLLGAAFLYAALFAMTLSGAALVIDSGVMAQALGHAAGMATTRRSPGWRARSALSPAAWAPALRATRPCARPRTVTGRSVRASARVGCRSAPERESTAGPARRADRLPPALLKVWLRTVRGSGHMWSAIQLR